MGVFEKSFRILFEIIKEPSFFHLTSTMKTFNSFLKAVAAGILLLGVSVSADPLYEVGDLVTHLGKQWKVTKRRSSPTFNFRYDLQNLHCRSQGCIGVAEFHLTKVTRGKNVLSPAFNFSGRSYNRPEVRPQVLPQVRPQG